MSCSVEIRSDVYRVVLVLTPVDGESVELEVAVPYSALLVGEWRSVAEVVGRAYRRGREDERNANDRPGGEE